MANIIVLGATSAIAEQFARLYAQQNNQIILVARNGEAMDEIKLHLQALGAGQVECIKHDFLRDDPRLLMKKVVDLVAELDILLLAYGSLPDQAKCQSDQDYAQQEFILNGMNPITILGLFSSVFKKQGRGTIAAISSVAGDRGRQSNYLYGSAKSALSTYLSGLRNTLSAHNVHVLTIKPGFVDTPMTKDFKKGLLWVKPSKVARDIKKAIEKKKDVLYTPWFWRWIMIIIKSIPEFIFKKLKL